MAAIGSILGITFNNKKVKFLPEKFFAIVTNNNCSKAKVEIVRGYKRYKSPSTE